MMLLQERECKISVFLVSNIFFLFVHVFSSGSILSCRWQRAEVVLSLG